jgi:colanic acid/amylovoran biosynthesis protein
MNRCGPDPTLCLFGAAGDTGNLGVSALGEATLHSVASQRPNARLLVFDNGRGRRHSPGSSSVSHDLDGAWNSRRVHRPESLWTMRLSSAIGVPRNRNVTSIRRSGAVLDISGGDSFTDLYGKARWNLILLSKLIALRVGTPLVLLPQTYGPFADPRRRHIAASVVDRAHAAWSRDPDGLDVLRDLLGDRFDPKRHREGVDVAFALPASRPSEHLAARWSRADDGAVTVGLNVSGLLMNDAAQTATQFGLAIDYRRVVTEVARRLLRDVADRLVLVPHVRGDGAESDDAACRHLAEELAAPGRVEVLPAGLSAGETKWCISELDWFCGTRMHATIAALSTGVPAAAIAYSLKTHGVFDTCGMRHAVVDARSASDTDAVDRLLELATDHEQERARLQLGVGEVVQRAHHQFVEILGGLALPEPQET